MKSSGNVELLTAQGDQCWQPAETNWFWCENLLRFVYNQQTVPRWNSLLQTTAAAWICYIALCNLTAFFGSMFEFQRGAISNWVLAGAQFEYETMYRFSNPTVTLVDYQLGSTKWSPSMAMSLQNDSRLFTPSTWTSRNLITTRCNYILIWFLMNLRIFFEADLLKLWAQSTSIRTVSSSPKYFEVFQLWQPFHRNEFS